MIGYGHFGAFVADAIHPRDNIRLAAVVEPDATLRAHAHRDHPYAECTADLSRVLRKPEIDAVHIATPPFNHAQLTRAALRAGKHVVVEKPMALRPTEAHALQRLARERRRVLAVDYMLRWSPLLHTLRSLTHSVLVGRPLSISLTNVAGQVQPSTHWFWDLRRSGGIHIEHGVHFFDAASFILGKQPRSIDGTLLFRGRKNTEATARVEFAGGTVAHFHHAFVTTPPLEETRWEVIWEHARAEIHGWIPQTLTIATDTRAPGRLLRSLGVRLSKTKQGLRGTRTLTSSRDARYRWLIEQFWRDVARAIRTGTLPLADATAGITSLTTAWEASRRRVRLSR